jgi:site-specific recombinase XerD
MADLLTDRDLEDLFTSWLRVLRGENKSPHTLAGYRGAIRAYLDYCAGNGLPAELSRENVIAFMAGHPGQASTARLHLTVLKLFAKWIATEENFDPAGVLSVRAPRIDEPTIAHLTDAQIARLLKVCDGPDLIDKRDRALVALFVETGLRASEMVAIDVTDIDVDACQLHVRRGKGGKGRRVRFSGATAAVVDRYLRHRRRAVLSPATGPLWIATRTGTRLGYRGLAIALAGRADAAGVSGFHLHRLRHTTATRWLRAGGSETGLRAHAGWTSNRMIERYTRAASEQLASEEFDRLGLAAVEL